ncbi:type IV secretory system conjugative DNA transfer family protein [Nocardioides flavescens]|uniref:Type IV secretion system DNA-binding domain-containing protein n=1 Tax=Nocardioides flavescens TaxID=2691959 RepID=A0A6L7EW74_9ACTN|nr:type IV secretion system DNA-binding domain-containing protein [Nocardioides flavescens]MXG88435.1 type IV secretion system DNA-binding domain-containing protein [Nocardioides flavescens]
MLLRLAADRAAPPLVFETRAEAGQLVQHFVGTPAEHVTWVQRTLRDLLPGLEVDGLSTAQAGASRAPAQRSVRLRIRPRALGLATDRPEVTSLALLSALDARLEVGERLVVQVVLGRRALPKHLPKDIPDPTQPTWQVVLQGEVNAGKPVRSQIDARVGQHGFETTIRIGVSATTPERRQRLVSGVLGALSTAVDRGTYIDLTFEPVARLNDPRMPPWWTWLPMRVGATELTGILGWPLGERDLPGVAPLHPKPLPIPTGVSRTERLFAVPGRGDGGAPVGIAARDITAHFLATGPTGVGKSTVLLSLVAADAAAGRAVLVIDPKWQLIRDIVERAIPEDRIDDVVILDPADAAATGQVVGFNPLVIGDRDPDVVVDGLVAVLAAVFHDGWGPRTEDIIHSALLTLARVGQGRVEDGGAPFTLLDLPRLLTDDRFRASVIGEVLDDPGLGSFWASYLAMSPAAQAQAIAAPLNKLRQYLLRPSLRAILGQAQPTFRLRDVFTSNKIVLVPLNEALIGPKTAQLLGSLVVAETWSATMERAREDDPSARPATVVIDEVQQYLHLPVSIDDALSRSRSYGVGWHIAHQHRAQLPPSTRAAADSNAKSKIVFQPLDPDDANAIARRAPDLDALDFMSLGRYQAYANLTVDGTPAGWALVRTLPPPAPTGLGSRVREHSRTNYANPVTSPPKRPGLQTADAPSGSARDRGEDAPLGRKRRQR